MTATMYAPVQHSGYGYGNDPDFAHGLETRTVSTAAQQDAVRRAGGVLFDSYVASERYCDEEMYPPGVEGLIPRAPGTFSDTKIDTLRVYVPVTPPDGAGSAG